MKSPRSEAEVTGSAPAAAPLWPLERPPAALAELLRRGGVLGIPTESSYGLAADPHSPGGVERVFRLKGRDGGKPLPVVVAGGEQLAALGIDFEDPILGGPSGALLAALGRCWPAPLTVVLPLLRPLPASAGRCELAVRVPAHPGLRRLLAALGPLTATSANPSGDPPLLEPRAVAELLAGEDAVVLDDGRLPGGPPSTLVRPGPGGEIEVLRRGAVSAERLRQVFGTLSPRRTYRIRE